MKYNLIAVLSPDARQWLMCRRRKEPYLGKLNLIGGKIEIGEESLRAAYRELYEETALTEADVRLTHLLDFTYYIAGDLVEVYAGRLRHRAAVAGDENELLWLPLDGENYFDCARFAGEGNIGHILEHVRLQSDHFD